MLAVSALVVFLIAVAVVAVAAVALIRRADLGPVGRMPRRRRATWRPTASPRWRRAIGAASS